MATRVRGQRVMVAAQSAWGTAASLTAADALECDAMVPPLTRQSDAPDVGFVGPGSPAPSVGRWEPVNFSLRFRLHGVSATTPTGNPAVTPELLLLANAFGAVAYDGYSTDVLATGNGTDVDVTTGVAAHVGHAVLIPAAEAASSRVFRWLRSLSTNTYTTFETIGSDSNAVGGATAGTAYGSAVCYLTMAAQTPLTIGMATETANDYLYLLDCAVSGAVKIARATDGYITVEMPMRSTGGVVFTNAAAAVPAAYTYPRIPSSVGANGAAIYINGLTTCRGEWTLTIDVTTADAECVSGPQGVASILTTMRDATLELAGVRSASWADIPAESPGATVSPVQIDVSTTPGRAASVLMPAPYRRTQTTLADRGGLFGDVIQLGPGPYTGDTGDGAPVDSILRLALA